MKNFILLGAFLFCLGMSAQQQPTKQTAETNNPTLTNRDDQQFIMEATKGAQTEIASARIALNQTKNEDVRKFANQMITDHEKSLVTLYQMVNAQQTSDATPTSDLSRVSGAQFDQAYKEEAIKSHTETISLYENYLKNGKNDELRKWVESNLPIIRMHLKHAEQLNIHSQNER